MLVEWDGTFGWIASLIPMRVAQKKRPVTEKGSDGMQVLNA